MKKIDEKHPLVSEIAKIHEHIPVAFGAHRPSELDITLRTASLELLLKAGDEIIVIEEGTLIAFIWYHLEDDLHIKSLWVHPEARRQGYATKLKRFVHEEARVSGVQYAYGDVHPHNLAMRALNEKLGYISKQERMTLKLEVQSD